MWKFAPRGDMETCTREDAKMSRMTNRKRLERGNGDRAVRELFCVFLHQKLSAPTCLGFSLSISPLFCYFLSFSLMSFIFGFLGSLFLLRPFWSSFFLRVLSFLSPRVFSKLLSRSLPLFLSCSPFYISIISPPIHLPPSFSYPFLLVLLVCWFACLVVHPKLSHQPICES